MNRLMKCFFSIVLGGISILSFGQVSKVQLDQVQLVNTYNTISKNFVEYNLALVINCNNLDLIHHWLIEIKDSYNRLVMHRKFHLIATDEGFDISSEGIVYSLKPREIILEGDFQFPIESISLGYIVTVLAVDKGGLKSNLKSKSLIIEVLE